MNQLIRLPMAILCIWGAIVSSELWAEDRTFQAIIMNEKIVDDLAAIFLRERPTIISIPNEQERLLDIKPLKVDVQFQEGSTQVKVDFEFESTHYIERLRRSEGTNRLSRAWQGLYDRAQMIPPRTPVRARAQASGILKYDRNSGWFFADDFDLISLDLEDKSPGFDRLARFAADQYLKRHFNRKPLFKMGFTNDWFVLFRAKVQALEIKDGRLWLYIGLGNLRLEDLRGRPEVATPVPGISLVVSQYAIDQRLTAPQFEVNPARPATEPPPDLLSQPAPAQ